MKPNKQLTDRSEWLSQLCECEMNRLHAYLLCLSVVGILLGAICLLTDNPKAGVAFFLMGLFSGAPVVLAMKDDEPL